jgi:hypothetical protein
VHRSALLVPCLSGLPSSGHTSRAAFLMRTHLFVVCVVLSVSVASCGVIRSLPATSLAEKALCLRRLRHLVFLSCLMPQLDNLTEAPALDGVSVGHAGKTTSAAMRLCMHVSAAIRVLSLVCWTCAAHKTLTELELTRACPCSPAIVALRPLVLPIIFVTI